MRARLAARLLRRRARVAGGERWCRLALRVAAAWREEREGERGEGEVGMGWVVSIEMRRGRGGRDGGVEGVMVSMSGDIVVVARLFEIVGDGW